MPGWCRVLALLLALSTGAQVALGQDMPASREHQLKAAFVYNFTKFISWPPRSFADAHAPIVIGIFGPARLAHELAAITRGRLVNGHPILVIQVATPEDARTVHMLFVGAEESTRFADLQTAIGSTPVVTVGESPLFAAAGGIINFIVVDDKVRFKINMISAERVGVKVSAQLQKLALSVKRNSEY